MRAGKLRSEIRIEEPRTTNHATSNEEVVTWRKFRDAYAEVLTKNSKEFFENGQRFQRASVVFNCRYFDVVGVTAVMRVKFDGQHYNILSLQPDHQKHTNTVIETELVA